MNSKIEITNLITPLINTYRTLSAEWKHLLDIGINDYIISQTDKYYFTNTFLHRSEKVRFDDIYYPVFAEYKKLKTDFNDLDEIFKEYKNITVIGSAGSGKTTLVKYIFLQTVRRKKKIPILLELRNLNDFDGDFEKMICFKVLKSKIKPNDDTLRRALESGRFLFLLDGYDEVFSNKKQKINSQIELFVDSYSKNDFLITTRPGSGIENFPRFYDFQVSHLEDEEVIGFIEKNVGNHERRNRIINVIENPLNNTYLQYLRNPLLLSMFILAFESHPEIPAKKISFYRNVFDTLYSRHDGITKNSFPREKLTKLQKEEFEKILSILSYLSSLEGKYAYTNEYLNDTLKKTREAIGYEYKIEDLVYDLRTSISILILDGFEYKFPHRSLQEYFTARFLSELPEDNKTQAYNNILEVFEYSSNDLGFHLWDICKEIDESGFTLHFLIPQLKKYHQLLNKKNDIELIKSYHSLMQPFFVHTPDDKKKPDFVLIMSFYSSFIAYCNIYDIRLYRKLYEESGLIDAIATKYISKLESHAFQDLSNEPEFYDLLVNFGLAELLRDFNNATEQKINELESNIKKKHDNIASLLNITNR